MYMNEDLSNKQILFFIIILSFFIILAIVMYHFSKGPNYEKVKIDPNENYVYKRVSKYSGQYKNIPFINVEGETAERFNQEIGKIEDNFASLPNNRVGFVFNKSGNILSVSIKMIDYYTEYQHPVTSFKTYLLNLDTKSEYTKEEIYQDYGVSQNDVSKSIEKGFRNMYQEVVDEGYVDANECDYHCFLEWRDVHNYLDGANFYIENKVLIVFRGFETESVFGEEDYFKSQSFKFEVQK